MGQGLRFPPFRRLTPTTSARCSRDVIPDEQLAEQPARARDVRLWQAVPGPPARQWLLQWLLQLSKEWRSEHAGSLQQGAFFGLAHRHVGGAGGQLPTIAQPLLQRIAPTIAPMVPTTF